MAEIYSFPNRDLYNGALSANSLLFPHIAKIEEEDSIEYADAHAVDRSNNPELMDVCVAQEWAKESNDYLTHKEAWAVTSLGLAFKNNTSIKSFRELKYFINVKILGNRYAFQGCTNLKVIDLRNIRSVEQYALSGSPSPAFEDIGTLEMCAGFKANAASLPYLKSLRIGKWFLGFTGGSSVYGCYSIDEIVIDKDNPYYLQGCNCLINIGGNLLLGSNYPNLPDDGTLKYISERAFFSAPRLSSLIIPEGVEAIGRSAFGGSAVTLLDIPSTVTSIGTDTFRGCGNLVNITCRATTPPSITGNNTFTGINGSCKIYVPAESVDAYKAASIWSGQAGKIVAIPEEEE